MKATAVVRISLLIVAALGSIAAVAQTLPHFQHIVLVIQENRTPDNLFGASPSRTPCGGEYEFEQGVDIQDGGYDLYSKTVRCLTSERLATCWGVNHGPSDWNTQADIQLGSPGMDKACFNNLFTPGPGCAAPPACPQYTFVQKSDVQPYFDIAMNYGFANYMFATNQGPSMPAHQFLFSGTSAPTPPGDVNNYYLDFVADNGNFGGDSGGFNPPAGCRDVARNFPTLVDYTGIQLGLQYGSCYDHPTLTDQLERHNPPITWRYYAANFGTIWTAPNAIYHLCYLANTPEGAPCNSPDWFQNMSFENTAGISIPVLNDIANCQLQQVSWVTPDERWSDHAGGGGRENSNGNDGGPSYVASIVDAIGTSPCSDNVNGQNYSYWKDTAIFIVWDDWGGWYDHVAPPKVMRSSDQQHDCDFNGESWGCGYVYGFRVPLLVVSAYTPSGYVSGAYPNPGMTDKKYVHDFGSILRFIENNFALNYIDFPNPYYADYNAPDNVNGNLPLSDFFTISPSSPRNFVYISPSASYPSTFFTGYFANHPAELPIGPDGGADED